MGARTYKLANIVYVLGVSAALVFATLAVLLTAWSALGLFQQRPSQGWGTVEQILDPEYSTNRFYDELVKAGVHAELHWCEGAGHNAPAGMPAEACRDDFATWVSGFFTRTLDAS